MNGKTISEPWQDADDAPALDQHWFDTAEASVAGKPVARRGRPPLEAPKQLVSIRLDRDLVARLKAQGPGWQTRVNDTLRRAIGLS